MTCTNFAHDVVGAAPPERIAVIELTRDGQRRVHSFADVDRISGVIAGCLRDRGVGVGDVVMTLIGSRIEWIATMIACFRIGAVVLPCPEQLRADDLSGRMGAVSPSLFVADPRNRTELVAAAPPCPILWIDELEDDGSSLPDAVVLSMEQPALMTFTSGTTGKPKAVVHAQRYLWGQSLQGREWLGAQPDEVVWCTASPGWSKAARNVFLAPWLCGATAMLHDARFNAEERIALIEREHVGVLCMAPTEYRILARRTSLGGARHLRQAVAAGEALDAEVTRVWRTEAGVDVRDGFGQTETGQLTGVLAGAKPRPGSMGRALPGIDAWIDGGELVVAPGSVPTFFLGYLGQEHERSHDEPWRTGDAATQDDDGYFWFSGRTDDVIISSGYRIGPEEVESVLLAHPAVLDAAAVSAPHPERGAVVRAVVALGPGFAPSEALAVELQEFVKARTAPYKYPRIVEFTDALPRTHTGKLRRGALRATRV